MSVAAELLQRHIQTLVDDHQEWPRLIADNIVWELAYAPAIGHPAKLSGRDEVLHHVRWFLGAVEHFRFIDPKVYAFTDPQAAVAQVKAEALIKPTGRVYRQEYVVFLRAAGDRIVYLREYFDRRGRPNRWMQGFSILNRGSEPTRWFDLRLTQAGAARRGAGRSAWAVSGHEDCLILNVKTAKALGLTVPQPLLLRADRVIE